MDSTENEPLEAQKQQVEVEEEHSPVKPKRTRKPKTKAQLEQFAKARQRRLELIKKWKESQKDELRQEAIKRIMEEELQKEKEEEEQSIEPASESDEKPAPKRRTHRKPLSKAYDYDIIISWIIIYDWRD